MEPTTNALNLEEEIRAKRLFLLLLLLVGIVNMLQSIYTEIGNDEAYYFLYSEHLDWGYYDHPPMVGLLIAIGTQLFGVTTLGVRIGTIILHLLSLPILFRLSECNLTRHNVLLFFIIAESTVMFTAYGFVTTPDAPLLFFSILFVYLFKKYTCSQHATWLQIILLALTMACTMYSKYHGAIVISLMVLLNWRVMRRGSFWISIAIAILLYLPHILWQVDHQFLTFQYHLSGRSSGFKWSLFPEYLGNQLAVFNPFLLIPFIIVSIRQLRERHNKWHTLLALFFWIVFFFFLLWNFKTRVEPHWTIIAAIALIPVMTYKASTVSYWGKYTMRALAPAMLLLVLVRIALVWDIATIPLEWHGGKKEAKALNKVLKERPLITLSGFQLPSKYHFYTGEMAHCLGAFTYRNTQFDFWNFDELYWGKEVIIKLDDDALSNPTIIDGLTFYLSEIQHYQPYKRLQVALTSDLPEPLERGHEYPITLTITNPYSKAYQVYHKELPLALYACYIYTENNRVYHGEYLMPQLERLPARIEPNETIEATALFEVPEDISSGHVSLVLAPGTPTMGAATLNKPFEITIK